MKNSSSQNYNLYSTYPSITHILHPEWPFDPQAGYEAMRAQLIDGLKK